MDRGGCNIRNGEEWCGKRMIMLAVVELWNDNGKDKKKKSVGCRSDAGDVFEKGRADDEETRAEPVLCCISRGIRGKGNCHVWRSCSSVCPCLKDVMLCRTGKKVLKVSVARPAATLLKASDAALLTKKAQGFGLSLRASCSLPASQSKRS